MDFAQYIKLGKEAGLTGKDLVEFVQEREEKHKEWEQKQKEWEEKQKAWELKRQLRELEFKVAQERLKDAQLKSLHSGGGIGKVKPPLFSEKTCDSSRLEEYCGVNDIGISNRQPDGLSNRLGSGDYYDNVGIDKIPGDDQRDHSRAAIVAAQRVNNSDKRPISNKTLAWGGGLTLLDASGEKPSTFGFLEGRQVSVLRATGCSKVMAKAEFIDARCFLGKTQKLVLIDRTVREYPLASIWVDTPFYVGQVEALVMESPLCDLVIGNIDGVRGPEDPNPDWSLERENSEFSVEVETENPPIVEVDLTSAPFMPSPTIVAQSLLKCEEENGRVCNSDIDIITSPDAKKHVGESRSVVIAGRNPPGNIKAQMEFDAECKSGKSKSVIHTSRECREMLLNSVLPGNSLEFPGEVSNPHLLTPNMPIAEELGRLLSWEQPTKTPQDSINIEIDEKCTETSKKRSHFQKKYRAAGNRENYTSRAELRREDYLRQATKSGRSKTSHRTPSRMKRLRKSSGAFNAKKALIAVNCLRKLKANDASDRMLDDNFARCKFHGRKKYAGRCVPLKLRWQGPHRVKLKRDLKPD